MIRGLTKLGNWYRYKVDWLGRDSERYYIDLSDIQIFFAKYIYFSAQQAVVYEIYLDGDLGTATCSWSNHRMIFSRPVRLKVELSEPVEVKMLTSGRVLVVELLHYPWKQYKVVKPVGILIKEFIGKVFWRVAQLFDPEAKVKELCLWYRRHGVFCEFHGKMLAEMKEKKSECVMDTKQQIT
jgi:hypothetical protein